MITDDKEKNKIPENDDEYEYMEIEEGEEPEEGYEYVEIDEDGNEIIYEDENNPNESELESNNQNDENTSNKELNPFESVNTNNFDELNPPQLTNIQLEYAYLGFF